VQIVDVNTLWVRSVVLTLRRRETPLTFVLFPMVHVGSPAFYAAVRARVGECDLAVVEGVGATRETSLLTLSYRAMRFNRRSGLVVQRDGPGSFGIPTICPDMDGVRFSRGWARVPWLQRTLAWVLIPIYAALLAVFGTRQMLARNLGREDQPSDVELDAAAAYPELYGLICDERDQLLIQALMEIHEQRNREPIKVAVVYGAAHMPAVLHALSARHRYLARDGEFLTVFDL
jgi:hypothetical protein